MYSLSIWELHHCRGILIMHAMWHWYIFPFTLSAMHGMCRRHLLKHHLCDVHQLLSSMREGVLLLEYRSRLVLQVHTRHLPPVYRGYELLKLLIMCSWHLQCCRSCVY